MILTKAHLEETFLNKHDPDTIRVFGKISGKDYISMVYSEYDLKISGNILFGFYCNNFYKEWLGVHKLITKKFKKRYL